jgi:hypothetical protein
VHIMVRQVARLGGVLAIGSISCGPFSPAIPAECIMMVQLTAS